MSICSKGRFTDLCDSDDRVVVLLGLVIPAVDVGEPTVDDHLVGDRGLYVADAGVGDAVVRRPQEQADLHLALLRDPVHRLLVHFAAVSDLSVQSAEPRQPSPVQCAQRASLHFPGHAAHLAQRQSRQSPDQFPALHYAHCSVQKLLLVCGLEVLPLSADERAGPTLTYAALHTQYRKRREHRIL